MELTAAIEALKAIPENIKIQIFTDSNYVREGISVWLTNWKKNNWKTVNKTSVKNQDLWIILDKLVNNRNVKWNWVKGHADCMNNNNADFVARSACDNLCNE